MRVLNSRTFHHIVAVHPIYEFGVVDDITYATAPHVKQILKLTVCVIWENHAFTMITLLSSVTDVYPTSTMRTKCVKVANFRISEKTIFDIVCAYL